MTLQRSLVFLVYLFLVRMKFDVANIADIFADLVITGPEKPAFGQVETLADTYEVELGGSGPIFASQFAKLGGSIAVITVVGEDRMGDFVLERMKEVGIDTTFVRRSHRNKTPLGLNISVKGDRSMLTVLGTLREIEGGLVPDSLLDRVRHWHVAGFFLLPSLFGFWPGFLKTARKKGVTISLDTNWSPEGNWDRVLEILPLVDLFFPNEEEAMAITGTSDPSQAGMQLSEKVPAVVMKRGAMGASVFRGKEELQISNETVVESPVKVVDTTGAGDSFDAGFIFEWLNGGSSEACLKTAIRCGTSNVQGVGGLRSQYTPDEKNSSPTNTRSNG